MKRQKKPIRRRKKRSPGRSRRRTSTPAARLRSKAATSKKTLRWNPDPEDVQRSVVKLVLSLVEFIRKLMERQAIRRMEQKTLTNEEVERIGVALMQLEETVTLIADRFGLDAKDLNIDLGPVGRLH